MLVVGHNPTMAYLVHMLDDGDRRPRRRPASAAGLPARGPTPSSRYAVAWADLEAGGRRELRLDSTAGANCG